MAFTGSDFSKIQLGIHQSHEYRILRIETTVKAPPHDKEHINSSGNGDGNGHINDNDAFTESHYIGVLDADLTSLTTGQKNFFIIMVSLLCCISFVGNVSTLIVNMRRKIRPFFRACLMSLAVSDVMNTLFLSTAYFSQFMEEYVQIWRLGSVMCGFVPFATTAAILASSMTLVGIAVDRYYAVMKAVIDFWNPTAISCIVAMLCIWLASIGIATPVFTIYNLQTVYILTEAHETEDALAAAMPTLDSSNGRYASAIANIRNTAVREAVHASGVNASPVGANYTLVIEQQLVDMCTTAKRDVSLYYIIVFVIIFVPCIGAFFWFNIIIARKLWKRRHSAYVMKTKGKLFPPKSREKIKLSSHPTTQRNTTIAMRPAKPKCNCVSAQTSSSTMGGSATTATTSTGNTAAVNMINMKSDNSREARHLRMFTIILLMMAVFVFLRLPAWIFLLMRMYGSYTEPVHWILYFVFGIMNLTSSVLNPLFYTFLTETIHYASRIKAQCTALICGNYAKCDSCCKSSRQRKMHAEEEKEEAKQTYFRWCCMVFCGCCGRLQPIWECLKRQAPGQTQNSSSGVANELCEKDNSDRDEGVDCSDVLEDDMSDFNAYNHRIYTIYPESLVSSSVNSK